MILKIKKEILLLKVYLHHNNRWFFHFLILQQCGGGDGIIECGERYEYKATKQLAINGEIFFTWSPTFFSLRVFVVVPNT